MTEEESALATARREAWQLKRMLASLRRQLAELVDHKSQDGGVDAATARQLRVRCAPRTSVHRGGSHDVGWRTTADDNFANPR